MKKVLINKQQIAKNIVGKGKKIFLKLRPKLEQKYQAGYYVTIDPSSEKYFVGKTPVEALHKAQKMFPGKQFFLAQVGRLAGTLR